MTDQVISPLRQRPIEDMAIRKSAPKTQHDDVQRVKDFALFLGRSPDQAQSEDVRCFRLHLASCGAGVPKINATVSALRFFFNVTPDRPDLAKHLAFMHEPRKAPVVLSPHARLPAISIPCGTDRNGLPFGLQIISARGQDRRLLGAAQQIEAVLRT